MKIFYLPDLGEGLAEAEIREWYVKAGDDVMLDQPLVSMETAKAVVDVPSPYTGKIITLHGKANDIIPTGAPLITFETADEDTTAKAKGSVVGSLEESNQRWDEGDVIIGAPQTKSLAVKALPAARVLAKQMNVDLSLVTPSGPQGLVTPEDVKRFIGQAQAVTDSVKISSDSSESSEETLHGVRRFMAQTMAHAHADIVPVTIIEDADVSGLSNADLTGHLLKAIVSACEIEPGLNAWFEGKSLKRKLFNEVNIGLAIDSEEGLFVPVLKNVKDKSLVTLRATVDNFKKGVKERSLAPTEMQGATITLSNFGSIAGRYATPIVVPPMVAILGAGRSRETAIIRNGEIVVGRLLPLSLTFDHRAVTGGEATRFLRAIIDYLQNL